MQCPLGFYLQADITPENLQTDVSGTQNEQKQQEVEKRGLVSASLCLVRSVCGGCLYLQSQRCVFQLPCTLLVKSFQASLRLCLVFI